MTDTESPAPTRPVYTDIGKALGTDYFVLRGDLTPAGSTVLQHPALGSNVVSKLTKSWITDDALGATGMSFLDPSDAIYHFNVHSKRQLFSQSNLVSDDQTGHLNAQIQDPNLINPWGVAFSPGGPFWVNNNHTGTATVYFVDPATDATTAGSLVVTIAPPAGTDITASPTGIVHNSDSDGFMLNGTPATFIMDTEDGTISAWNGGTMTTLKVDNSNNPAHGDGSLPPQERAGAQWEAVRDLCQAGRIQAR